MLNTWSEFKIEGAFFFIQDFGIFFLPVFIPRKHSNLEILAFAK